jgi:hypothetical protein
MCCRRTTDAVSAAIRNLPQLSRHHKMLNEMAEAASTLKL